MEGSIWFSRSGRYLFLIHDLTTGGRLLAWDWRDPTADPVSLAIDHRSVASSPDEVKAIIDAQEGSNIAGSQAFRDARDQIPEGSQLLFVDTQALLQKFGPQLEQSIGGTFTSLVEPNLRPVKALIVTSGQHGDAVVSRLFLLIR